MSGEGNQNLQVRCGVVLTAVQQRGVSSWTLLSFAAVAFMARTVMLMLGPLLVILANDFGTSIAMAGQLAAATFVAWGITAPLVGPISDTYGRKPVLLIGVLLMALGVLGSGAAWSYGSLLATRLIAGAGTAMLPMTMMAALADNLPPEKVGKAVGFITASSWVGLALGVPAIALLGYIGGWRLPFYITGGLSLALWVPLYLCLPSGQRRLGQSIDLINRFKVIGRQSAPWYVLIANATQQAALLGLMTYFAAYMIENYGWDEANTAPGLALLGVGAVIGSFVGGFIAGRARRLEWLAAISLTSGAVTGLFFVLDVSAWILVAVAFVASVLVSVSMPVLTTLIMHLAGQSRGTAGGMFTTSAQAGGVIGSSAGGLMLSLGGYPAVGLLYLVATVLSASVVGLIMRRSPAFRLGGVGT
ncbi:MAG: MFS transporter [SAR202 cluster bacterium]|nr:MFS transporter [SAR202 cluster bacterium]